MSAVLARSELDNTIQILTTGPALTSGACGADWLVYDTDCLSPTPWLSRGEKKLCLAYCAVPAPPREWPLSALLGGEAGAAALRTPDPLLGGRNTAA